MSTIEKTKNLLQSNNPYDKSVTWLLHFITLFAVIALGLLVVIYFQQYSDPKQKFFAVYNNEINFPMESLEEPNVAPATLLNWASLAVTSAFTMDFNQEDSEYINRIKGYFTKTGLQDYLNSVEGQGFTNDIRSKKLISTAIINGHPLIVSEGNVFGKYTWTISVPVILTHQGTNNSTPTKYLVFLTVQRIPTLESYLGIGIERFVANQRGDRT